MSGPAHTIMIVDDEFSIVETLAEILTWEGYAVVTAPNGREALDEMTRAAPSLLLVDFMMPVMDGLALIRSLRDDSKHARLPVILMSAARVIPPGEERQYDALLRKPFEIGTLLDLVRRLLAG